MSTEEEDTDDKIPWNTKLEGVVQGIGDDSSSYMMMHMYQAQRLNIIYNRLIIAGIVIGPLSGICSTINQVSGIGPSPLLSITEIILGFMSGIIVAIIKFGKYDEASNSNQTTAARYTSLAANVKRQMSLERSDRINALKYLDWLQTKYDEMILSAPILSPQTHAKFVIKDGTRTPKPYENVMSIVVDNTRVPTPVKRTNSMPKIPEINEYSDQMLRYEIQRMYDK